MGIQSSCSSRQTSSPAIRLFGFGAAVLSHGAIHRADDFGSCFARDIQSDRAILVATLEKLADALEVKV